MGARSIGRHPIELPPSQALARPWGANLAQMADRQKLSQDAFNRLRAEHDDLTTRGRIEIAKKIETARELGDLSENGDYHAAKEEQGKMEGRIIHLAALILDVEIVDSEGSTDVVREGCIVSIQYGGEDEIEQYLIGSIEERRDGVTVMSPGSPMGKALLGAKLGETVKYEAPGGLLAVSVVALDF
ncbi:MAG: transcription elongation factor GreA [Acidimicrobiales bacterium]